MISIHRRYSTISNYRYKFNGQEHANELNSSTYDFGFRMYDARIGRFFSTDPREADYPWQSTYVYFGNSPIVLVDYMGMGEAPTSSKEDATALITNLGKDLKQSTYFKNTTPVDFVNQLKERVSNPSGVHQGNKTYFCWAAACVSYLYEKNPAGMVEAMFSLYNTGTFCYDNGSEGLSITPPQYINDVVGTETFKDNGPLYNSEIDQMLFLSLGAKFKGYLNNKDLKYDPGDESGYWASGTLGKVTDVWKAFGYNINSFGSDLGWANINKGDAVIEALKSQDVILYVNSSQFIRDEKKKVTSTGTHYIRIHGITQKDGVYFISYWDYGKWKKGADAEAISTTEFWWATFGMITIAR